MEWLNSGKKEGKGLKIICLTNLQFCNFVDRIISAINTYFEDNPNQKNIKLHFAGDGPKKENLVKVANESKFSENIIFHG